jgi:Carbohydrate esterase, sialic acid-specific acetylesterase/Secretion system C-terminal sorting domain
MYRPLLSFLAAFWSVSVLLGQQAVTLTRFPQDNQIYQRDVEKNTANVQISGKATRVSGIDAVELRVFRDTTRIKTQTAILNFANDAAGFHLEYELAAGCRNHRFELWSRELQTGLWKLEMSRKDVVAGDLIIINGQSNAQAYASPVPEDLDPFTRSYFEPYKWGTLNLSFPGQWGARLAKRIVSEQKIPVGVFNQAQGAMYISSFLRDDAAPESGNYGALMQRLKAAGSDGRVRAAFWFQGEADAWHMPVEEYKKSFVQLKNAWKQDFGIERAFLFQNRYKSCDSPLPLVLEAQRQIPQEQDDVDIMSTTNADHDGCHFNYLNGYQSLADRMYELVANRLYKADYADAEMPDVERVWLESPTELFIQVRNTEYLQTKGWPWLDFKIEGKSVQVIDGSASGNRIRLKLNASAEGLTGVSYLPPPGIGPHWVTNSKGVGLPAFYKIPVSATVSAAETDAEARFSAFPNPARDRLRIERSQEDQSEARLRIFDALGRLTYETPALPGRTEVAVSEWPAGYYVAVLQTVDGRRAGKRFAVVR